MNGVVSTIIPVYNRAQMLREAVESVLAQTYRSLEVIVVDDGSTDDTANVAEAIAHEHPDLVRVLHIENRGPGGAREAGRLAAHGEFIQYLDSDDRLLPGKFAVQITALRANSACGIAYGQTRLVDEHNTILKCPYKWTGRRIEELFPALLVDRWWNTHTPLYRRTVTDAIGAWTDMRMCEDWEYDGRAAAQRTQLVYCDVVVSETRCHSGVRLTNAQPTQHTWEAIGRLLVSLKSSALQAGVDLHCPEMRHFARWAFSTARRAGAAGATCTAEKCLEIAVELSDATGQKKLDLQAYRHFARLVGWTRAGQASDRLLRWLGRAPGRFTLDKSEVAVS